MAQIVQRPMRRLVPIGRVPTARTRVPYVVATVGDDLRLGQVSGHRDPFARVGSVLTWTEHRVALLAQWLGPELYDQRLLGATRSPRYSLKNAKHSAWLLFILAHVLGHILRGHVTRDGVLVDQEVDRTSATDAEERAANAFALE